MARKADVKGGNGDVIFDLENGIARKYLRNTSSVDKVQRFEKELKLLKQISTLKISNIVQVQNVYISSEKIQDSYIEMKKYDGSLYDIAELRIHKRLVTGLAAFLQVFRPEELLVDTISEQLLLDVVEVRHPFC